MRGLCWRLAVSLGQTHVRCDFLLRCSSGVFASQRSLCHLRRSRRVLTLPARSPSCHLVCCLQGYRLFGKDDRSFIEDVLRLLRSEWQTAPHLSAPQFLARGFAERKLLLVVEVVRQCTRLHDEGQRALDTTRTVLPYTRRVCYLGS
jgi:hypothetical protein